jgi:hypothetical protein
MGEPVDSIAGLIDWVPICCAWAKAGLIGPRGRGVVLGLACMLGEKARFCITCVWDGRMVFIGRTV